MVRVMPPLSSRNGDVIFVVDDDRDLRTVLGEIVEDAGYRPVLFETAESLLASLAFAAPEVIVTDIVMPGLSGPELIVVLGGNECWQRIPVIVLTGNNDTALPLPLAVPVVYKPDIDGLMSAIRGALRFPDAARSSKDRNSFLLPSPLDLSNRCSDQRRDGDDSARPGARHQAQRSR